MRGSLVARTWVMLIAASILLAASAGAALGSGGAWEARYRVTVSTTASPPRVYEYVVVVRGFGEEVADASISSSDPMGSLVLSLVSYPGKQHFLLGRDAAQALYSWRTVRIGDITYKPLFTAVAYSLGGETVMGVLVEVSWYQGHKRAVYDCVSGLLLEEEFTLTGLAGMFSGLLRIHVTLEKAGGLELAYVERPVGAAARTLVYGASALILVAAARTILLRHRYTVV